MMKSLLAVLLLSTVLPVNVLAANTSVPSLADTVAALPTCAVNCLTVAIANSTCSATDQQCICTNVQLNDQVNSCVALFCTVKQGLITKNATSVTCGAPIRDRRLFFDYLTTSFAVASWVAFLGRMLSRYLSDTELWWDDAVIILVMIIGIPSVVLNVRDLAGNGLGKDIWTLSFKNISDMIHAFFASELLYFSQVSLIKVSILFLFLRLFPESKIRRRLYGTIIFNFIMLFAFLVAGFLQCRPISFYWKRWDGEHQGSCLNINALTFTHAGMSIALDLWMLVLPLAQIVNLNLNWKRKVSVGLMLSVGILITIVSILRLQSLTLFSNSNNPTWDYLAVGYWSTIEICVGIICACMPGLRLLLVQIFPGILPTTFSDPNGSNHAEFGGLRAKHKLGYDKNRRRTGFQGDNKMHKGKNNRYSGAIRYQKSFDVVSMRQSVEGIAGIYSHDPRVSAVPLKILPTGSFVEDPNMMDDDDDDDDDGANLVTIGFGRRVEARDWV